MPKTKLTLSIDDKLILEVKAYLAKRDRGISEVVELFLRDLVTEKELVSMMDALGIEQKYISYEDVVRGRPGGLEASGMVRETRDGREKSISRQ